MISIRSCPRVVPIAMIKQWPKPNEGSKCLFSFYFHIIVPIEGDQSRNSNKEPRGSNLAETMGECYFSMVCLMASSPCFLVQLSTTWPGMPSPSLNGAPPHHYSSRKCSTDHKKQFFQWCSFSSGVLSLCQDGKTNKQLSYSHNNQQAQI